MGDREVSRLGRVDEVGVAPAGCEFMRRGASRGEAIVDIFCRRVVVLCHVA